MPPAPPRVTRALGAGASLVPGDVPCLVTARLVVDRLTPADAAALFAYRSLPDVCRYQTFEPLDEAGAAAFIAEVTTVPWGRPGVWSQAAVRERASGALAGDLGVHFVDQDQAEVGFTIAPPYQRRGYATEAVAALLGHLFGAMALHRVTASVDPRNLASIGVLRRLGLRREAHFRRSLRFKGEWADDLVFAVLDSEWPPARA